MFQAETAHVTPMHVTFCINSTFFFVPSLLELEVTAGLPLLHLTIHLSLLYCHHHTSSFLLLNYSFVVCDETLNIPSASALAPRVFFISSFSLLFSALLQPQHLALTVAYVYPSRLVGSTEIYPYCYEQNEERKRFTRSLRCDASRRHSEAGPDAD